MWGGGVEGHPLLPSLVSYSQRETWAMRAVRPKPESRVWPELGTSLGFSHHPSRQPPSTNPLMDRQPLKQLPLYTGSLQATPWSLRAPLASGEMVLSQNIRGLHGHVHGGADRCPAHDCRCYCDRLASERIGRGKAMPLAYTGGKHILPGWGLGWVGHLCLGPDLSRDKPSLYP